MSIVTTSSRKRKPSKTPLAIILLVVVLSAAAFLVFRKGETEPASPAAPVAVKAPVPANNIVAVKQPSLPPAPVPVKPTREEKLFSKTNNYVKKAGRMMLPNGKILTFKPPKEGEVTYVTSGGHRYECDSEGNWKDVTPKPIFNTPFENQLVGLSVEGGTFIPGFLKGYNQDDVVEILKRDVVVNENDPEDVVAKKEAVVEMKGIILDYIEQGGSFDQFVDEMYAFSRQERALKSKGMGRLMKLYKAGDIEGASKFRDDYNAVLDQNGFTHLRLPKKVAEALDAAER